MPSREEILRALQGAWLLAKGNISGLDWFDLSVEGFWKSFAALLLAAPAYAVLLLDQYARFGWPQHLAGALIAEAVGYVAGWLAFPLAAIFLTRFLGLADRYVPLIVAVNWTALAQIGLYLAVVLAGLVLPGPLFRLGLLTAAMVALVYQWFVVRTALRTGSGTAVGLVLIDLLLGLAVSRGIDGLLQPG